jgi:hypothetical protein
MKYMYMAYTKKYKFLARIEYNFNHLFICFTMSIHKVFNLVLLFGSSISI